MLSVLAAAARRSLREDLELEWVSLHVMASGSAC